MRELKDRLQLAYPGQEGSSLVEAVIATLIFMFAFQAALLGFGSATERGAQADHRRAATAIAQHVVTRVQALGDASCATAAGGPREITRDRINGNVLTCLGTDVTDGQANCDVDHPQNLAEAQSVVESNRAGMRDVYRVGGAPWTVYMGIQGPYRVVWNVRCTASQTKFGVVPVMKRVQVNVAWPPYANAWSQGRVVTMSYTASASNS